MKRVVSLVALALLMAAMVLASALPALAAPPTLSVTCITPPTGVAIATSDPKAFNDLNAFYRDCAAGGGTATRELTPNPGPPAPSSP